MKKMYRVDLFLSGYKVTTGNIIKIVYDYITPYNKEIVYEEDSSETGRIYHLKYDDMHSRGWAFSVEEAFELYYRDCKEHLKGIMEDIKDAKYLIEHYEKSKDEIKKLIEKEKTNGKN